VSRRYLVQNTFVYYIRTLLSAVIAVFTSRWLLGTLGEVDFGLVSLVGSLLVFVSFLNGVLAAGACRYFAVLNDTHHIEECRSWFNAALTIHGLAAVVLPVLGWLSGHYLIHSVLTVPQERLAAVWFGYNASLISCSFGMLTVPFSALLTARQRFKELAVYGLSLSLITFSLAFALRYASSHRLEIYFVGVAAGSAALNVLQILRAVTCFPECRIIPSQLWNWGRLRSLTAYSGWLVIGGSGAILRDHGSAVLINVMYGPQANAAYGLASTIAGQANTFASALITVLTPEMAKREGHGDRLAVLKLISQINIFGTLFMLFFAVPLFFEADSLLTAWLGDPPEFAGLFCRGLLAAAACERATAGIMVGVNAAGRIARYQASVGVVLCSTLPLGYVLMTATRSPAGLAWAFMITSGLMLVGRLYWGSVLLGASVKLWAKQVCLPILGALIISGTAGGMVSSSLAPGLLRILATAFASSIGLAVGAWVLILDAEQRKTLLRVVQLR
jgi:O-antigen/teichoic acid export membrane protein